METLDLIIKHGLMIRQIPEQIRRHEPMRNHVEGNEIFERKLAPSEYDYLTDWVRRNGDPDGNYKFDHDAKTVVRLYSIRVVIPEQAGFWLVKKSPDDTSSTVRWVLKDCYVAKTLDEAVRLCVEALGVSG